MLKSFIISLFIGLSQPGTPTPPPHVLLQQFLQDIADNKLDETALAQKYMCPSLLARQGEKGDKARMLFHMTLASYREDLRKQRIDPQSLVIIPFDVVAARPLEIIGDTQHVYVAQYKGETFGRFLMQDGKIAALNLLNKGNRGYFLPYCE